MGGFGSGRHSGWPTVEQGLTLDLARLIRKGWVRDGSTGTGSLEWTRNGKPSASIGYSFDLTEPDGARLTLRYTWTPSDGEPHSVEQLIRLTWTSPHYGGRRWWFVCPSTGRRAGKLHLPPGGGRFASRIAWRLPYRSQRSAKRDRPFDRLFRLQQKLGSDAGWEAGLYRPKGMHHRTFERHLERYWQLDAECGLIMIGLVERLSGCLITSRA